jgi:large conductance mechanosensitive channel
MFDRARKFLRHESLGITIPVGVVVGVAGLGLLRDLIYAFVAPVIEQAIGRGPQNELQFSIGDVTFRYVTALSEGIVFALLLLILYMLFHRPAQDEGGLDFELRECPECRSDIAMDAKRCAFCTSVVTPLAAPVATQGP